jgi:DNA repair photolyase
MEPRASTPTLRLDALRKLSNAGVPVSIGVSPIIPALNDHEIERILDCGAAAGVDHASFVLLRLPLEVSPIFKEWLLRHVPDKYRRVMSLIRSMRGGKDYDSNWKSRMRGEGPYAWQIGRRFELQTRKLGIYGEVVPLRTDLFQRPGGGGVQLALI